MAEQQEPVYNEYVTRALSMEEKRGRMIPDSRWHIYEKELIFVGEYRSASPKTAELIRQKMDDWAKEILAKDLLNKEDPFQ